MCQGVMCQGVMCHGVMVSWGQGVTCQGVTCQGVTCQGVTCHLLVGEFRPVVSLFSGVAPSWSWSGCLLRLLQHEGSVKKLD